MTEMQLAHWKLGTELGRGPLGVVYRGYSIENPTHSVAIKLLHPDTARSADFSQRFARELLVLQRLNHPNIARIHESGIHAGTPYYVSEYVEGTDLETLLKQSARTDSPGLPWNLQVLSIAVQVARGLKHGHHRSVLHREIRPSNIVMMSNGILKLTDYGIGKVFPVAPLTLSQDLLPLAGFLAPEYFIGKPMTRRSDLYSLGVTLYTLLTGRPPFIATTPAEMMHKQCYVLPDRPSQFVTKLPSEYDDLVCDLLQKDPNRRPATAAEVIQTLEQIRGKCERKGTPVVWPTDTGTGTNAAAINSSEPHDDLDSPRKSPRFWTLIPLFLALIAVIALIVYWPRPSAESLFNSAQPLMESENPEDWERAIQDYLDPLSQRHPDQFAMEIQAFRQKVKDYNRLNQALRDGKKNRNRGEIERLYQRGLALAGSGDIQAARRSWEFLTVYAIPDNEEDRRYARLAREGIRLIDTMKLADKQESSPLVESMIAKINALRAAGKTAEIKPLLSFLSEIASDDPTARPYLINDK